jgi:predicted Zn-dependent protease
MPTTADLFDLLRAEDAAAALDTRIVDRSASIHVTETTRLRLTSLGGEQVQHHRWVIPSLAVTAHVDGVTQTRSLAGNYNGFCRQGGFEVVLESGLIGGGSRIAD